MGIESQRAKSKNKKILIHQANTFNFSDAEMRKLKQCVKSQTKQKKKKWFRVSKQNGLVVKVFLNCSSQWDLHPVTGLSHRLKYSAVSLRLQAMPGAEQLQGK